MNSIATLWKTLVAILSIASVGFGICALFAAWFLLSLASASNRLVDCHHGGRLFGCQFDPGGTYGDALQNYLQLVLLFANLSLTTALSAGVANVQAKSAEHSKHLEAIRRHVGEIPVANKQSTDKRRRPRYTGGMTSQTERAILAGGCFWGMQELLRDYPGVISTRVGYTGGDVPNATYLDHGTHAEAIEIVFDPSRVSYQQLLEFFFQIHDPTTLNRQGNDRGMSYRSAIFYTTDEQRRVAEDTVADVDASGIWPGKVVTDIAPAGRFWEAEPEHQDYLQKYPNGYTCHYIRPNWRLPQRAEA